MALQTLSHLLAWAKRLPKPMAAISEAGGVQTEKQVRQRVPKKRRKDDSGSCQYIGDPLLHAEAQAIEKC